MIASTRRRVSGATSGRPLITFETVGTDTPARRAISATVGRSDEWRRVRAAGIGPEYRAKVSVLEGCDSGLTRVRWRWQSAPETWRPAERNFRATHDD